MSRRQEAFWLLFIAFATASVIAGWSVFMTINRRVRHTFIDPVPICYGYGNQHGQPCHDVYREYNI